jgi:hypothetical protein
MSGAIPLLPLWAFGACYRANVTLPYSSVSTTGRNRIRCFMILNISEETIFLYLLQFQLVSYHGAQNRYWCQGGELKALSAV